MKTLDANSWEDYCNYIAKKTARVKHLEKTRVTKKEKEKKLKDKNSTTKGIAKYYVNKIRKTPSVLEKRMQEFLDSYGIVYEFQKPLYIKEKRIIKKFYIADFYIPAINLIIETDGKFHDNQVKEDIKRTKDIQRQYPNMKILRWKWHDFDSLQKMKRLIDIISTGGVCKAKNSESL